jgi:hypothetical protein
MPQRPSTISVAGAFVVVTASVTCGAVLIVASNETCENWGHNALIFGDWPPFSAYGEWSFVQRLLFAPALGTAVGLAISMLLLTIRTVFSRSLGQRIVWLPSRAHCRRDGSEQQQPQTKGNPSVPNLLSGSGLRWYQHVGQALLGIAVAFCALVALIAVVAIVEIGFGARQAVLLSHLESLGARVMIDKSALSVDAPRDRDVAVFAKEAAGDLRSLSTFDGVWLNLSGTKVTDADIEQLGMVRRLISLNLAGTSITDGTLSQLTGSGSLYVLNLDGTKVTDAGLAHLKRVPHLSELSLARTQITDDGLRQFDGLRRLCYLSLANTRITDKGLTYLRVLPKLRHLDVRGTQVTSRGTSSFQWHNIECEILR